MTKFEPQLRLEALDSEWIKSRIERLKQTDLRTARIDRLKSQLTQLLLAYVSTTLQIDENRSIFRARKHRKEERESFLSDVDQLYPQAQYIKRLGRANRKKRCIYYFAADEGIALNEVKPSPGDVVTLLECKPLSGESPFLIPIGAHQMAKKHEVKMGGDFQEPMVRISAFLQQDRVSLEKHKMIDRFVLREFLRNVKDGDEHKYKLSVAIAELLLRFETDLGAIDGLVYPSLASKKINANLAFVPTAFHRIYRATNCKRITILRKRKRVIGGMVVYGFSVAERQAKRVRSDGEIEW